MQKRLKTGYINFNNVDITAFYLCIIIEFFHVKHARHDVRDIINKAV